MDSEWIINKINDKLQVTAKKYSLLLLKFDTANW